MNETKAVAAARKRVLSVEGAVWLAILLVALALRLIDLDAAPLTAPETSEALAAWRASTEGAAASLGDGSSESPFLLAINAVVFTLFGASDGAARLWPALAGSGLVLTPWLLQQRIGRIGSLAAGLLLAISPTMLVASRQVDGSVLAALGFMLTVGGASQHLDSRDAKWMAVAMMGLALSLSSSPVAYGLLVPLAVAAAATAWARTNGARAQWESMRPGLTGAFVILIAALGIFSTGFGWRLPGLAEAAAMAGQWASGFAVGAGRASLPFIVAGIYEFLPFCLAIGGLAWAVRQKHRFGTLVGIWAGLALAAVVLRPLSRPLEAMTVAIPTALLSGIALEALISRLGRPDARNGLSILAPTGLGVSAYIALLLAHYAKQGRPESLFLVLLALGLQGLLVIAVAYVMQAPGVFPSLAAGWVVALLLATVAVGWGVTHVRFDDPRELLLFQPTDPSIRRLVDTLTEISWEDTGAPRRLAFSYESGRNPVLSWYLRDFPYAHRVTPGAELPPGELRQVHVTGPDGACLQPQDAVGRDFPVLRSWDPGALACTWRDVPDCENTPNWIFSRSQPPEDPACAWYERLDCTMPLTWVLFRSAPSLETAAGDVAILWLREAEPESSD